MAFDRVTNLVINDFSVLDEDYLLETKGKTSYILLNSKIITSAFVLPYSTEKYPVLSTENGQITLTWKNQNEVILRVDMIEGSKEAYINNSDEPIDMGVAPKTVDDKLFIPINLLLSVLKMDETYDLSLDLTFLHCEKDFPKDLLLGSWSDNHTDIFTTFEDTSGLKSLSSSVNAYQFKKDGTYQQIIVVVDGFIDGFAQNKGKYKILGNTLIFYDIYSTYYKGTPFKLVYENQKSKYPSFNFIDNYDPNKIQIEIGGFWLNQVES